MENQNRTAIVMRSAGSSYTLRDTATGSITDAKLRGRLRLNGSRSTNPVAVGDVVDYQSDTTGEAVITQIHQRKNYIIRRSPNLSRESHIIAANLDQAALVATLFMPETSIEFIDRFLVTCEAYGVAAAIILNKCDLLEQVPDAVQIFREVYEPAGYPVFEVSAENGTGVSTLEDYLRGKTTLLSGNSGVGKSSLIKRLIPSAQIRTAPISDYHHKGRHTTTFAQMYQLPQGGDVIDTPGIKGFGLLEIDPRELYRYFPEMLKRAEGCQYYNCTHVHEPGCAVREAVEAGEMDQNRYVSYLKMLDEDEKYRK